MTKDKISIAFQDLQTEICNSLEKLDGKSKFLTDPWSRKDGGGGVTRVIQSGALIEKGGVNFSAVHGKTPEKILTALSLSPSDFFATGVSIVIHPISPMVPIIHMNVRYFEMANGTYWFGGGIDLTPHYINKEDAKTFHTHLKKACDKFDNTYYPKFKKWADDYFYLKHRKETRGIGGIFFDHLKATDSISKETLFDFVLETGKTFIPAYTSAVEKNRDKEYGQKEIEWQRLRRGRYVEFNLIWDKGTKFGLDTDGRTEAILMSLPNYANWIYDYQPEKGSKEAETQKMLKKDIDWLIN